MKNDAFTFEKAYERLESILEQLNSGEVSLDLSLKLYEEADKLIRVCQDKLTTAEQKIQFLIKDREGKLQVDDTGIPMQSPFQPTNQQIGSQNFDT